MPHPAEQDARSSLSRGLALLELFSLTDSELSVSEMARRAKMPKSTTHRLVNDLLRWGALERGRTGIRLGVRLFEFGSLVPGRATLRELAAPFSHALGKATGLTSNLGVREGDEVIYLEKIASRDLPVPHSRLGGRLPLHCTALGKAILAYDDAGPAVALPPAPLVPLTPWTITSRARLETELDRVRRRGGVAFDLEESRRGMFCVGAPVFAPSGRVVGALSVTGSTSLGATSLGEAEPVARAVLAAARALTRALGSHRRSPPTRYAGRQLARQVSTA